MINPVELLDKLIKEKIGKNNKKFKID